MDYRVLMKLAAELGTRLAVAGAETYRVEESIVRVLAAYGLDSRVYSVPNSLFITIMVPGELPITQLCRMKSIGTDLDAVEKYNNFSRAVCEKKPDPEVALQWLEETDRARKAYSFPKQLWGHILVACGLCVFYGGAVSDVVCAGLCGLFLGLFSRFLGKYNSNTFFQNIASGFAMALFAYGLAGFGLARNIDTSVIGTLMLLVPGLLFTNALRDIIFGDINSGVNRVVTAILIAAAVALGTAAAWNTAQYLWGIASVPAPIAHAPLVTCTGTAVACTGFLYVWNIHGKGKWVCPVGGFLTWAVFCFAKELGFGYAMCCLFGTLFAAAYAEVMARVRKYPAISYLVIGLISLIPGANIYYTAQQALQGNMDRFIQEGTLLVITAGVMAVGIILVSSTARIIHPIHPPVKIHSK